MAIPTANKVITFAKSFARNTPYYSPNQFTRWYGFGGQAVAWCAVFVYYCLCQTGGKTLMEGCANKAYCPTIWNWGVAKGYSVNKWSGAKEGDLVLFDWEVDGVCDHIGFAIKDNGNGTVQTVEGNTNGGRVQIQTRNKSVIKGFIRLPYSAPSKPATKPAKKKSVDEIAKEVIAGKWGTGNDRIKKLTKAGYDPKAVQAKVNNLLSSKTSLKPLDTVAKEVISGKWGSGNTRKKRLEAAGYNYSKVQKRVNELLGR